MNSQPGITGSSGTQDFGANNLASLLTYNKLLIMEMEQDQLQLLKKVLDQLWFQQLREQYLPLSSGHKRIQHTNTGAGQTYRDPNTGQVISAATGRSATSLQTSITAAKRVAPQLERIASDAAPFMTLQDEAKTWLERGKNYAFGGNSELPSKYAAYQSELKAAPESLVKAYGLNPTNETIERMSAVMSLIVEKQLRPINNEF